MKKCRLGQAAESEYLLEKKLIYILLYVRLKK